MEFYLLKEAQIDEDADLMLTRHSAAAAGAGAASPQQATETNIELASSSRLLSAETLKILCYIDVNQLDFNSRFELLFNDMSMLKASAVQGLLANSNLRSIAWMIFLECIPFDKSKWIEAVSSNRDAYERMRRQVCCDPRKECIRSDHPLSQQNESLWNKHFAESQLKSMIMQDVIRMYIPNIT